MVCRLHLRVVKAGEGGVFEKRAASTPTHPRHTLVYRLSDLLTASSLHLQDSCRLLPAKLPLPWSCRVPTTNQDGIDDAHLGSSPCNALCNPPWEQCRPIQQAHLLSAALFGQWLSFCPAMCLHPFLPSALTVVAATVGHLVC